jgi:hypothetical protein
MGSRFPERRIPPAERRMDPIEPSVYVARGDTGSTRSQ